MLTLEQRLLRTPEELASFYDEWDEQAEQRLGWDAKRRVPTSYPFIVVWIELPWDSSPSLSYEFVYPLGDNTPVVGLHKQLTNEEQRDILYELFGLVYEEVEGHWVLYDEDGHEFFGFNDHLQFNFSTLAGIFSYMANRSKMNGYSDCQRNLKKVLGL